MQKGIVAKMFGTIVKYANSVMMVFSQIGYAFTLN